MFYDIDHVFIYFDDILIVTKDKTAQYSNNTSLGESKEISYKI